MKPFITSFPLMFVAWVVPGVALAPDPAAGQAPGKQLAEWQRQASAESAAARREAAQALAKFPDRALPTLLKLLQDPDAGVRLAATQAVRTVVAGVEPLTVYGPEDPGLVLVPRSGTDDPAWTGGHYNKILSGHAEELKTRLKKLRADEPRIRAVAEQTLHRLDVRLAAVALTLKAGRGKPVAAHPQGKAKVEAGGLTDAKGKRLAKLTRRSDESVSCWAFKPDGRLLAVGISYDSTGGGKNDGTIRGYLRVYDPATGELLGDAGGVFGPITHVAFSEDGKVLLYQTGQYKAIGGK
jgi:hypothetical protein